MEKRRKLGVEIQGCIFANDEGLDISHDEFWDKFIGFIEGNGWHFGGGTTQIDEEGNVAE